MKFDELINALKKEIKSSGVPVDSVSLSLGFSMVKGAGDEVTVDFVDSKSRRTEHVHRMNVTVPIKRSKKMAPDEPEKKVKIKRGTPPPLHP